MSMITATTWVPRGFAAQFPAKYDFDEEEFSRISKLAQRQLEDAQEDLDEARHSTGAVPPEADGTARADTTTDKSNGQRDLEEEDDDLKEYDLDHYDEDDDDIERDADMEEADDDEEGGQPSTMSIFGNIKSLVYHSSNAEDPYITLPADKDAEDSDSEREEMQILPTDNLVLAARIEDEVAHLEVYVYEDDDDNLYVHHDIMLPAIPLAVEWLDLPVGKQDAGADARGNFVAVGTMDPDIEIWDLDTVDCMYPNAILGAGGEQLQVGDDSTKPSKKKKKTKKSKKARSDYHVDAVLSLAANRSHRNLLASASADSTVKLWDLNTTKCAQSYSYHDDKVCSIAWHPREATALLSGSYDKSVIAGDMRAPEQGQRRWWVDSDVENLMWDPHDNNYFYVSTESGLLYYYDARTAPSSASSPANPSSPVWRLQAHSSALSTFAVNPIIPGFIATGSSDKTVKLWNIDPATGPSMVVSRDLDVGRVFSTTFGPDAEVGFRLAVAGSKGNLQIWDTSTNKAVREAFATRVAPGNVSAASALKKSETTEVTERLTKLAVDDEESDDDNYEEGWEEEQGSGGVKVAVDDDDEEE